MEGADSDKNIFKCDFFTFCNFRPLRPQVGLVQLFFIICGHFDHGCLKSSARSHCMYLERRGKTRNEMVIPDQS